MNQRHLAVIQTRRLHLWQAGLEASLGEATKQTPGRLLRAPLASYGVHLHLVMDNALLQS